MAKWPGRRLRQTGSYLFFNMPLFAEYISGCLLSNILKFRPERGEKKDHNKNRSMQCLSDVRFLSFLLLLPICDIITLFLFLSTFVLSDVKLEF